MIPLKIDREVCLTKKGAVKIGNNRICNRFCNLGRDNKDLNTLFYWTGHNLVISWQYCLLTITYLLIVYSDKRTCI